MRTLTFELAGAPRGKERPRFVKATGRAFTAPKTVAYEGLLRLQAQEAMGGQALFSGPLKLILTAYMPIPVSKPKKWQILARSGEVRPIVKPDFDNIAKMMDGLNLIVWTDDAQIVEATINKFYSDTPKLVFTVQELKSMSAFD